jgi:hypothetical protein
VADVETELALADDAPAAAALASDAGAILEPDGADPLVWWLTLVPRAAPGERYFARIGWARYPHSPPSVRFAAAVGGRLDSTSSWPVIAGYRPGAFDICQPFTAEGFAVHPEWVAGPEAWTGTGNPFLWIVSILVHDFCDRYQGRSL